MTTPPDHPLTDDFDHRHGNAWWVHEGVLRSSRSVRPFHFTYDTVEAPDTYAVRAWRWRVDGLTLTRHRIPGTFCVAADTQYQLYACE